MAPKRWNPVALEAALAKLNAVEPGSLHGSQGEIAVACRKLGEARVLWLCFEAYEDLEHGVGKATRTDARAFLAWAERSHELRRHGPSHDQALSPAQRRTWALAMKGTDLAPLFRVVWNSSGGEVWKRRQDGKFFSRSWPLAECGDWWDPHSGRRVCCDFLVTRCADNELCPRAHTPTPYGPPSFMPSAALRYQELFNLPGPHGMLLSLRFYECALCGEELPWFLFPHEAHVTWATFPGPPAPRGHVSRLLGGGCGRRSGS